MTPPSIHLSPAPPSSRPGGNLCKHLPVKQLACRVALLAAVLPGLAWGQGSSVFVCVDASGRRITSDRPIAECINREQREIAPTGAVKRVIAPQLTAEERALAEQQAEADTARKNRDLEQQRRDRALLLRYPGQPQHDAERQRQLALQQEGAATLEKREQDLKQQEKDLRLELEFYKSNPSKAPVWLTRKLTENTEQQQQHRQLVAMQLDEKRRINQRFDDELARLKQLWTTARPAPVR
jgi:hypothetical protein